MPAVGSSKISTAASTASQRPIITFCWLPPESVLTSVSIVGRLDVGHRREPRRLRDAPTAGSIRRLRPTAWRPSMMLSADRLVQQQPLALAVGGEEGDAGGDRTCAAT